jgi:hypothetical protein
VDAVISHPALCLPHPRPCLGDGGQGTSPPRTGPDLPPFDVAHQATDLAAGVLVNRSNALGSRPEGPRRRFFEV